MKKINYRLFLYELIFAVLVIFVHASFTKFDYAFDSLGRASVLFFFMVSSYFYCSHLSLDNYQYKSTLKRCLRLLIILLITLVVYIGGSLIYNVIMDLNPPLFSGFSFANIDDFLRHYSANTSFLWFMNALIICYLVFPLIYKIKYFHNKSSIWVPLFILLVVYIFRFFANKYDLGILSYGQSTRNFLLTGLPCFLIGQQIFEHKDELRVYIALNNKLFYITVPLLFITGALESYAFTHLGSTVNEFYLSSVIIAILALMHGVKYPESKAADWCLKVFGKKSTTIIYLSHVIVYSCFFFLDEYKYMTLVKILITEVILLLVSMIYHQIEYLIKNKKVF